MPRNDSKDLVTVLTDKLYSILVEMNVFNESVKKIFDDSHIRSSEFFIHYFFFLNECRFF